MRIFANPNYNFIKWRWHALIISIVIIWAGVGSIYFRGGLPMGIDFTGGTALVIEFDQSTSEGPVRTAIDKISKDAVVQKVDAPEKKHIFVRLPGSQAQEQGASLEEDARRVEVALREANLGSFRVIQKDLV